MKANEALELYIEQKYNIHSTEWNDLNEVCRNALIIEFFDSVGIYISIHYETFGNHYFNVMVTRNHLTTNLRTDAKTRAEAANAAIIKANDLFNENK